MTYQIQTKYPNSTTLPLWQDYGTTTVTPEGETIFTPYTTNSVAELQEKLEDIDAAFGYENIRAIAIPVFTVDITVNH